MIKLQRRRDCSDASSVQSAVRLIYPVALKFDLKFTQFHHHIVGRIEKKCHLQAEGANGVFQKLWESVLPRGVQPLGRVLLCGFIPALSLAPAPVD